MKKNIFRMLAASLIMSAMVAVPVEAGAPGAVGSMQLGKVSVDNIGMNKRMIRFDANNGIIVDDAGICLEVGVNFSTRGLTGKRVHCIVSPLDAEGNVLADRVGEAMSVVGLNVPSASYTANVMVPIPYNWVVTESNKSLNTIKLGIELICASEEIDVVQVVDLTQAEINVDKSKLGGKLMSDVFGGTEGMMGSLLGGLFGGSDATATTDCPACDGTKVCQSCDGDGFLEPSLCRKCQQDPGICRKCKGKGTVTMELDFY